jgi:hypothetical protein
MKNVIGEVVGVNLTICGLCLENFMLKKTGKKYDFPDMAVRE